MFVGLQFAKGRPNAHPNDANNVMDNAPDLLDAIYEAC